MTAPAWLDGPDWPARRCAYCGVGPREVCVGLEHEAWTGELLCHRCYARVLAEVPVLPGGRARAPAGGPGSPSRCTRAGTAGATAR